MVSDRPSRAVLRIEIAPRTFWYALLAVFGVWAAVRLTSVVVVVLVALILVGTFDPLVAWLERRGVRRGRALAIAFLGFVIAFAALLLFSLPPLVTQLLDLVAQAPRMRDKLVAWLSE